MAGGLDANRLGAPGKSGGLEAPGVDRRKWYVVLNLPRGGARQVRDHADFDLRVFKSVAGEVLHEGGRELWQVGPFSENAIESHASFGLNKLVIDKTRLIPEQPTKRDRQ